VVAASEGKQVLQAVAGSLPDDGENVLTKLELYEGWGDILVVRLHVADRAGDRGLAKRVRESVTDAVGERRHQVEIVWCSAAE
jgi:hypothetical protein